MGSERKWLTLEGDKKMNLPKPCLFLLIFLGLGLISANTVLANQPTVTIEAPAEVPKGSEITIRITIDHSANDPIHHVKWVQVLVNYQVVVWREYSLFNLPEDYTFRIEIKYTVNEDTEIRAEAGCNFHGSRGPTLFKVSVKE
jgi:desulfoferrodoxin (superoxide reductase-like protein)